MCPMEWINNVCLRVEFEYSRCYWLTLDCACLRICIVGLWDSSELLLMLECNSILILLHCALKVIIQLF